MCERAAMDCHPLSPLQQGMLFHYLSEPDSGVDIEQLTIRLREETDSDLLGGAWNEVAGRHEILHARFEWEARDAPVYVPIPGVEIPLHKLDWRDVPTDSLEQRLDEYLDTDRAQGFDMNRAPMMRLHLIRLAKGDAWLVWTFHHALMDGRSFSLVLDEVFSLYDARQRGESPPFSPRRPYRDFVAWLESQDVQAHEAYWREHLRGYATPIPLMIDRVSVGDNTKGKRRGEMHTALSADASSALQTFANKNGLTMNTVLQGAWTILLHRYSGEEDIVFGATRACRKASVPEADEMVGLFINTLPVRAAVSADTQTLSLLKALRAQWLDLRAVELTPLSLIKNWSEIQPSHPLFESLVVYEHQSLDATMKRIGKAWEARRITMRELTNFPVTIAAYGGARLRIKCEYDRRHLDPEPVRRMMGHLGSLLEAIPGNANAAVSSLPMLPSEEQAHLVDKWSRPAMPPAATRVPADGEATLPSLFERIVAEHAQRTALVCNNDVLTYEDLNKNANRLAHRLRGLGIGPDMLVALCVDRTNELVTAILGIMKAGGAYLPIDLAYPAERLAFMIEDANALVLITESKLVDRLPSTSATVILIDQLPDEEDTTTNPEPAAGPDHLAYVIYTSGTTGKPKGTMITHRNVVRLFGTTEAWFEFGPEDAWTLFHSCAFDFSVWEIWGALLYGGKLVVVPYDMSRSPDAFYRCLVREKVTVLNQTPSAFRQLVRAEEELGRRTLALRYVIFGGEALEMQSLRPWFERHGDEQPRLINMYGITETTVHVTYRPLRESDVSAGSVIGRTIPDLSIYILEPAGSPAPIGIPGELHVGGAGLARGYLNRPELTADRFVNRSLNGGEPIRLYRTGDLARWLPNGDIEYLGRIDHQVKIRGFRIELGEIESVLCEHPSVLEAVVVAREDMPGEKKLAAYLVADEPAKDPAALRAHLERKLPNYMSPSAYVMLEKLPLTENGKVDRTALPAPDMQRSDLATDYVAPQTRTEKILAQVWAKVLRMESIGVDDNFFEVGGDSILSIQVISLARGEKLNVTPKQLFENPTIGALAALVEHAEEPGAVEESPSQGEIPLTPVQHWFLEQSVTDAHHYNQEFLFNGKEHIDAQALSAALSTLEEHHEALRLRFEEGPASWRQWLAEPSKVDPLQQEDLSGLADDDQVRAVRDKTRSCRQSLDLRKGPLWRVVYFDLGPSRGQQVFVVIHHLAVDGISWRILLEDLESAYRQALDEKAITLPRKTSSYKKWSDHLASYAGRKEMEDLLPYWRQVDGAPKESLPMDRQGGANIVSCSDIVYASLSRTETRDLLRHVPAVYNTQIQEVLLAALAQSLCAWTGSRDHWISLEGHGREDIFTDVDLSRTVGWFTSIFPMQLSLPDPDDPGSILKSIKEQVRKLPGRGLGYGVLRYLRRDSGIGSGAGPALLFNYLGQFDSVVDDSSLFQISEFDLRTWRSAAQARSHLLEVNCMIRSGCLETHWTYSRDVHDVSTLEWLAGEFVDSLRKLIAHCLSDESGGNTPSDFPAAGVDQATLDTIAARVPEMSDLWALSPIQLLFYARGAVDDSKVMDQWHCTLEGPLDRDALERAWSNVLQRHPILRGAFQMEGLTLPVLVIHKRITPDWKFHSWEQVPSEKLIRKWNDFLQKDRSKGLALDRAPLVRFAVVKIGETRYKFVWTVPALLMDGWSWPRVFADLSNYYEAECSGTLVHLSHAGSYRQYITWLRNRVDDDAKEFWVRYLDGFTRPTPLPLKPETAAYASQAFERCSATLDANASESLVALARKQRTTLNTLIHCAWALVLSRLSNRDEVLFGASFSGRPPEISGVESIVGPFVNNLPVRVRIRSGQTIGDMISELHRNLLEINLHQFSSSEEIQSWSGLSWKRRLFDSIVVLQNYHVDEAARRLGLDVHISDFVGPIHTNFPLLLLVETGPEIQLSMIYDTRFLDQPNVEAWGKCLARTLSRLGDLESIPASEERDRFDLPTSEPGPAGKAMSTPDQHYVAPRGPLETTLAGICGSILGNNRISVEQNMFDAGAHSLLMVTLHRQICSALDVQIELVRLFEFPTIRDLARYLRRAEDNGEETQDLQGRAEKQRAAFRRLREVRKR
jgi:amino acid adenylation domain-containing protein/non-ribosomal peptide synthase protein (TIGR01720 family)